MAVHEGRSKALWLVVYVLWIVGDIEFAWGWDSHHLIFLFLFLLGSTCVAYAEFENKHAKYLACAAMVIALAVLIFAPPVPAPEPWRGWLLPANDPTPPNGCALAKPRFSIPPDTPIVVAGTNGVFLTRTGRISIVTIGKCAAVAFERTAEGIRVSAPLYDGKGNPIGEIVNNKYDKIPKNNSLTVQVDLHTIDVHDVSDSEILFIHFANRKAIEIRGRFYCPSSPKLTAIITDNAIRVPGVVTTSDECYGDSPSGICINCIPAK